MTSARGKLKFLEKYLCHCHQGTTTVRNDDDDDDDDNNNNNPPQLQRFSDSKWTKWAVCVSVLYSYAPAFPTPALTYFWER